MTVSRLEVVRRLSHKFASHVVRHPALKASRARAARPGREMEAPRDVNATNLVPAFNITANLTRPGLEKHALSESRDSSRDTAM